MSVNMTTVNPSANQDVNQKTALRLPIFRAIKHQTKPDALNLVMTKNERERVQAFGQAEYAKWYPAITTSFKGDRYNDVCCTLYSENQQGKLVTTARILFDSPLGLPNESLAQAWVNECRENGKRLIEVGEFIITENARGLLKTYYRAFWEIANENDIDYMLIIVKQKDIPFHREMIGASVLVEDTKNSYGSRYKFSCLSWPVKETKPKFLKWAGINAKQKAVNDEQFDEQSAFAKTTERVRYPVSEWNQYARLHASIMTSQQLALFREACAHLYGKVIDCGCGTAKLAPLMVDNPEISHYVGVDYAQTMTTVAQDIIARLPRSTFSIRQAKIEAIDTSEQFTTAVSIHSYYAWPKPLATLAHIYALLQHDGLFVLATPNKQLDQAKLLHEAEKELIAHPDFAAFKAYNLQLEANPQANFIDMDELIKQTQQVGFKVVFCHQEHYEGGVNFLLLRK